MAKAKNNLTVQRESVIILSEDEKRIITNLRRYAGMYQFSELAILFQVHDGKLKYGTLCFGSKTTIRI